MRIRAHLLFLVPSGKGENGAVLLPFEILDGPLNRLRIVLVDCRVLSRSDEEDAVGGVTDNDQHRRGERQRGDSLLFGNGIECCTENEQHHQSETGEPDHGGDLWKPFDDPKVDSYKYTP